MRNIYSKPNYKSLDQGMIFNSAVATEYVGREVLGIVISPRCDIEHKKNTEVHYLPIVRLEDWLAIEGKYFYCEKYLSIIINKIKAELNSENISNSILINNSPSELFTLIEKLVKNTARVQKIRASLEQWIEINKIQKKELGAKKNAEIFQREPKIIKELIKELVTNKRKEYYFLEPVEKTEKPEKYLVVLNREIKKIGFDIAEKIPSGLVLESLKTKIENDSDLNYKSSEEIIYPLAVLNSPFLEHLMQQFLSNFNRIGVTDHDSNLTEYISTNIKYHEISFY